MVRSCGNLWPRPLIRMQITDVTRKSSSLTTTTTTTTRVLTLLNKFHKVFVVTLVWKRDRVVHIVLFTLCCTHCSLDVVKLSCCTRANFVYLSTGFWGYRQRVQPCTLHANMQPHLVRVSLTRVHGQRNKHKARHSFSSLPLRFVSPSRLHALICESRKPKRYCP